METLAIQQYLSIINDTYTERSDLDTYTEYDGIPQFNSSDLNLILLFHRSMVLGMNTTSTNIAVNFPRSTFTNIEEITAARSYFIILLCLYLIHLLELLVTENNTNKIHNVSQLLDIKYISKTSLPISS